jgi:glycosyltransferase involved in cell wall biosynthesis
VKLVWIAQDLHRGGGERVIIELSAGLAKRGHEVHIIYPRGRGGFPIPPGVLAREVGIEIASPMVSLITNLPALIAAVPPCDWILCSMPISVLAGYIAGQFRSAKVLSYIMTDERILFDDRSSIQSGFLLEIYHHLVEFAQRLPVTIAANSHWTLNRIHRGRGGEYPIVYPGINLDIFRPDGAHLLTERDFTIVCVGRRRKLKGLAELIEALNRVQRFKSDLDFQLRIITQEDLDTSAARFPCALIHPDTDHEIATAYRGADLFVMPSWFEGIPLPPLEAMACGVPCLLTDCGGIDEYARNGHNCRVVPVKDPDSMSRAIIELYLDRSLRNRFSDAGLKTAAVFGWENSTSQLEAVLNNH